MLQVIKLFLSLNSTKGDLNKNQVLEQFLTLLQCFFPMHTISLLLKIYLVTLQSLWAFISSLNKRPKTWIFQALVSLTLGKFLYLS